MLLVIYSKYLYSKYLGLGRVGGFNIRGEDSSIMSRHGSCHRTIKVVPRFLSG